MNCKYIYIIVMFLILVIKSFQAPAKLGSPLHLGQGRKSKSLILASPIAIRFLQRLLHAGALKIPLGPGKWVCFFFFGTRSSPIALPYMLTILPSGS
jgi:hypothetical protein